MPEPPPRVTEARQAMGTRFEIVLPGTETPRLLAAAEAALYEVERLEAQLSMYRIESEISGLNVYAAAGPIRVEPRLFQFLSLALDVSRRTGGAFDPTVGPLIHCWGFTGAGGKVPEPEEIEAARSVTGAELVELDPDAYTARFRREGVSLDLGAIGKGYAIDRALDVLEDAGIERALIHGGTSTVGTRCAPPGEQGWRVALRDPRGAEGDTLGEVLLRDRALSVSAPHGKSFAEGDRLYGHVLDPRTGRPTEGALLAAVSHPSATLTDALSTALLVLGAEGISVLERGYPEADCLVVVAEGEGVRQLTGGPGAWDLRLIGQE